MSRAGPSLADGQLAFDDWWWEGFTTPVVETSSNNHESVVHWPDFSADGPQPACDGGWFGGRDDVDYQALELYGGLAAFRRPCTHERCLQPLARKAREMGVRFDG